MTWRLKYLTTRRHPLALALYAATFLYGIFFMTQAGHLPSIQEMSDPVQWVWRLEFVIGGGIALLATLWKPSTTPHHPDLPDLIRIEGVAAIVAGLAFVTYAVSVELLFRDFSIGTDFQLGLVTLFVVGLFWRGGQALVEASYASKMGAVVDDARAALERLRKEIQESADTLSPNEHMEHLEDCLCPDDSE